MAIFNKKKKAKKYITEHHFLFVEVPFQGHSQEALAWGLSAWWPKKLALQYQRDNGDGLQEGADYKLILKQGLLKTTLKGEMIQVRPNRACQIEWRSGLVKGQEFVIVEERSNGMRIDFRARYAASNLLTQLIWALLFRRKFNDCIKEALEVFKHTVMSNE